MAITCPNCGFAANPNDAESCQQCNTLLSQQTFPGQTSGSMTAPSVKTSCIGPRSAAYEPTGMSQAALECDEETPISPNRLSGRVTWIETSTENVDFNWCQFLTQLFLFIMFLPLLALAFAASTVLWIALAILGFSSLSREVSPFNIANTMNSFGILLAIIFPRIPQRNQVPAFRFTVQNDQGERAAFIKGEMTSGTFRKGDELELDGEWRNGTLIVQRGYNRSLQTSIEIRGDYWRFALMAVLGLIIILTFLCIRGLQ